MHSKKMPKLPPPLPPPIPARRASDRPLAERQVDSWKFDHRAISVVIIVASIFLLLLLLLMLLAVTTVVATRQSTPQNATSASQSSPKDTTGSKAADKTEDATGDNSAGASTNESSGAKTSNENPDGVKGGNKDDEDAGDASDTENDGQKANEFETPRTGGGKKASRQPGDRSKDDGNVGDASDTENGGQKANEFEAPRTGGGNKANRPPGDRSKDDDSRVADNFTSTFFGQSAKGRYVMFLIDGSDTSDILLRKRIKNELIKSIEGLEEKQRFSLAFYNETVEPFNALNPINATDVNKREAIVWITGISASGQSNTQPPVASVLGENFDIIYMLSYSPIDALFADRVSSMNVNGTKIHTIGFADDSTNSVLKRIAIESGGVFRKVD